MLDSFKSLARKIIIPAVALTTIWSSALGQNYSLNGKVRALKDATGSVIENVRVDLDASSYIAKTDVNGNFIIPNIPQGNHKIRFDKNGYDGFEQIVAITSNKTLNASLPEITQTNPKGTGTLDINKLKELYISNGVNDGNPYF